MPPKVRKHVLFIGGLWSAFLCCACDGGTPATAANGCDAAACGVEASVDASGLPQSNRGDAMPTDANTAPAHEASPADGAIPDPDAGTLQVMDDAGVAMAVDAFGTRAVYATAPDGRVWRLPDNAEAPSDEWNVEQNPVDRLSPGVFRTMGNNGEVRLTISSPRGAAWWRNVEVTGYFRYTGAMDSNGQLRHWELLARCERHSDTPALASEINGGLTAPVGTATWPGYPYASGPLNAHCLGTSYHGNFYVDGHAAFEKEISHIAGYAGPRAATPVPELKSPLNRWVGLKFVRRNAEANRKVHLELWLDSSANNNWKLIAQMDDTAGLWSASGDLDGCGAAPFGYTPDQLITWAGPWLTFRSDSIRMDFRGLTVREIAPLP